MGRKKEAKPLLVKHSQRHPPQQQNTLIVKKIQKGKHSKPKLSSVSEASVEGGDNQGKEMKSKCLEKDVDESQKLESSEDKLNADEGVGDNKVRPPSFGVRSYLHHFYEKVNNSNTDQEEEYHYLIHPKGRRWGAVWFKIGLIIGATLFLLGAVAIVIGYAIPKQKVILGRSGDLEIIDNDARRFNENLDRCKLIGLAGFCSGGLVLVISLLAPTFTSTYWDEDPAIEPFRVSLSSNQMTEAEPKSPIPVTEKIKSIQPVWID